MATWCPACHEACGVMVAMGAGPHEMIRQCAKCGAPAMDIDLTPPAQEAAAQPAANVVPIKRPAQGPAQGPYRTPAFVTNEQRPIMTAESLVADARANIAQLDVEIPRLQAELARAKAHRRGLARMLKAYNAEAPAPEKN